MRYAVAFLLIMLATPAWAGLDCLRSEVEVRGPHSEGEFSRLGRTTGDVPRYHVRNTACIGRLNVSVNAVVGQGWGTVNDLGSGFDAFTNSDTYTDNLTPHWYVDARWMVVESMRWGVGVSLRNSLDGNDISDHFGVVVTRDWLK